MLGCLGKVPPDRSLFNMSDYIIQQKVTVLTIGGDWVGTGLAVLSADTSSSHSKQLRVGPEADNKWAVDKIINHAGSGQEAVFEILWKAGDITWLPYYQIEHLLLLYNSIASALGKFSLYIPGTNGSEDMVAASIHPVTLRHFHITPQQCGLGDPGMSNHAQKLIMEQFAVEQARKSRIHEEKFMARENRRQSLFGSSSSSYFDDLSSLVTDTPSLLEFEEPTTYTSAIGTPNNSKSNNKSRRAARMHKKNDPISDNIQTSTLANESMVPPIETMPSVEVPSNGDIPMV